MKNVQNVVITPETNYADIIVPTADTVRISFLMDMLLTNEKPVSTVKFDWIYLFIIRINEEKNMKLFRYVFSFL